MGANLMVYRYHCDKAIALIRKQTQVKVHLYPHKNSFSSWSQCWQDNQSIHIGTKDRPENILKSIAHELGHCLLVQQGSNTDWRKYTKYRLGILLPKRDRRNILKEERMAWTLGFRWLRRQGLPITQHMKHCRKVLLSRHQKRLRLP